MLRAAALMLLAANLLFAAWTQGQLAPLALPPMASDREPQRLLSQLRPETVSVLDAQAAARVLREQRALAEARLPPALPAAAAPAQASRAVVGAAAAAR